MPEALNQAVRDARRLKQRDDNPNAPSRVWSEEEVIDGETHRALTVILRTRGCTWAIRGGCSMCGYVNDSFVKKITADHLVRQFETALSQFSDHTVIKLYTSGSFLDDTEVPEDAQRRIAEMVPDQVVRFQSEAQAHHVTKERLSDIVDRLPGACQLAFGIGMEASTPEVLEHSVNNEFTIEDYREAAQVAHDAGARLKCYVLVKPPFLTEKEAILEAVETARRVADTPALEAISFNPVSVHKNTLVEELFRSGDYSPPWLWSVVDVLERVSAFADVQVHSDVVAGGQARGAHNCGACDEDVLRAIDAHKKTGDASVFERVSCSCRGVWEEQLALEGLGFAGGGLASTFRDAVGSKKGRSGVETWYKP